MAFNLNGLGRGLTIDQLRDAMNPSKYFVRTEEVDGVILSLEQNSKLLSPILIKETNNECSPDVKRGDEIHLPYKQHYANQGN